MSLSTLLFIQAKISEIFPVVSDNFLGTMSPRPRGKKWPGYNSVRIKIAINTTGVKSYYFLTSNTNMLGSNGQFFTSLKLGHRSQVGSKVSSWVTGLELGHRS